MNSKNPLPKPTSKPRWASDKVIDYVDNERVTVVNLGSGDLYHLNKSASIVWKVCDGKHTLSEIASTLGKQFSIDKTRALRDIQSLVKDLSDNGLIGYS